MLGDFSRRYTHKRFVSEFLPIFAQFLHTVFVNNSLGRDASTQMFENSLYPLAKESEKRDVEWAVYIIYTHRSFVYCVLSEFVDGFIRVKRLNWYYPW